VLASIIVASGDRYLHHPEAQALLFRRILNAVRVMPGVESAGTLTRYHSAATITADW
jgi:hypothetical protein